MVNSVSRCPTPDELFLDEEVIPNDSEVYGPPSSMPWLPSPLSIKLVRPPTRDVFQMISNSFAMLIFLYVIYVIPLIASSDDDQTFRFDFDSHPYSSLYDQAYYTSSTM
ncbi:unnamed protein product [Notodromas monacha]|uniref:Transmembrane protein n=1 Tax=Notodromas monacha TaxID=399045 RepID=A0A7R9GAN3_9CRUS|nr:unnamed protein product [Notodromas monacha]CAG0913943.1 unnamed protein product [Notodromas monacha]